MSFPILTRTLVNLCVVGGAASAFGSFAAATAVYTESDVGNSLTLGVNSVILRGVGGVGGGRQGAGTTLLSALDAGSGPHFPHLPGLRVLLLRTRPWRRSRCRWRRQHTEKTPPCGRMPGDNPLPNAVRVVTRYGDAHHEDKACGRHDEHVVLRGGAMEERHPACGPAGRCYGGTPPV